MTKHIDPVCGMEVDSSRAAVQETFGGKTYYFCSAHCRESFAKTPTAYVHAEKPDDKKTLGAWARTLLRLTKNGPTTAP
ncbi:MAG: YHS domain-containing protein [Rhodospirillales bacterium]|nr:YHS domain-containing protein [Rhodospirillales bacterium]